SYVVSLMSICSICSASDSFFFFFFFNATAPTEIYTLSLHDALPISRRLLCRALVRRPRTSTSRPDGCRSTIRSLSRTARSLRTRSEEHTSELQSRGHLVCRLLLEKKKKKN